MGWTYYVSSAYVVVEIHRQYFYQEDNMQFFQLSISMSFEHVKTVLILIRDSMRKCFTENAVAKSLISPEPLAFMYSAFPREAGTSYDSAMKNNVLSFMADLSIGWGFLEEI